MIDKAKSHDPLMGIAIPPPGGEGNREAVEGGLPQPRRQPTEPHCAAIALAIPGKNRERSFHRSGDGGMW